MNQAMDKVRKSLDTVEVILEIHDGFEPVFLNIRKRTRTEIFYMSGALWFKGQIEMEI